MRPRSLNSREYFLGELILSCMTANNYDQMDRTYLGFGVVLRLAEMSEGVL